MVNEPHDLESADQKPDDMDAFLVQQVQGGYKDAYNLLVIRHQYKVFNIISRYVKDPAEAKDVAQEAFIRAYRALGKFRGDSAFYTWLYRIVVNTAKNHIIQQSRQLSDTYEMHDIEVQMDKLEYTERVTPETILQKDELEQHVHYLIDQLPDDLKTALTLREIDGMTYDEIAEVMLCPVGTVRSRIYRAREAIEANLAVLNQKGKEYGHQLAAFGHTCYNRRK